MSSLYKIIYYKNSDKVRRRAYAVSDEYFNYGSYSYTLIGYDSINRDIYLGRVTSLGHLDIVNVYAGAIGCEWK